MKASLQEPLNPEMQNSIHEAYYASQGGKFANASYCQRILNMKIPKVLKYLRFGTIALSLLQIIVGGFGVVKLVTLNITSFLVSMYAMIFAFLLLAFECRFQMLDGYLRENFGFLYTYYGRTCFIIFVGFVDFGMHETWGWVIGFMMCFCGMVYSFVICFHPEFKNGYLKGGMDPTEKYNRTIDEEAGEFLAAHPKIAAKAGRFVFQSNMPSYQQVPSDNKVIILNAQNGTPSPFGYNPPK